MLLYTHGTADARRRPPEPLAHKKARQDGRGSANIKIPHAVIE